MNRIIDRLIDSVHKKLVDVEASVPTSNNNTDDQSHQQAKQQILEIGRLTEAYESNLNTINNYLPSVPTKDIERYHKHYSELEERASKEIKEYENITAIAIDNATKAGITNPEQYISEYAQDCKIAYLDDCEKRKALLSKIKIVIHSDGTITSTNTDTGESARFTNQFEFIE